jgi:large subunit ribosomal protein L21
MPNVNPGDVLRFNRASVIGSRDFTLKGTPYIDERMFECRVRVLGVDAEPLRIKEKTKRRQRHVRRVKSKHKYTLMRVMDVKVKTVEELLEEGAHVIEDGAEGCEHSSKVETKD